jgi:hypothetical protein
MVQVQADRFAAELLALQPRFQGFEAGSHRRPRAVDQTEQHTNRGRVSGSPVYVVCR